MDNAIRPDLFNKMYEDVFESPTWEEFQLVVENYLAGRIHLLIYKNLLFHEYDR